MFMADENLALLTELSAWVEVEQGAVDAEAAEPASAAASRGVCGQKNGV